MKNTKLEESHVYEFCKVCKINHNQGRRHNFFPRHANSLSSLLSRFATKLSAVKSALKHPALVGSSQDTRFWCIFCEAGVDELGSSFTSENVLKHLASEEHLKELKHFMWKYGGGMNKVDSFRVTEAEVAKWKKGCEVLQSEAASSSGIHHGSLHGQSNEMRITRYMLQISRKLAKAALFYIVIPCLWHKAPNMACILGVQRVWVRAINIIFLLALMVMLVQGSITFKSWPIGNSLQRVTRISLGFLLENQRTVTEMFILGHLLLGLKELKPMVEM